MAHLGWWTVTFWLVLLIFLTWGLYEIYVLFAVPKLKVVGPTILFDLSEEAHPPLTTQDILSAFEESLGYICRILDAHGVAGDPLMNQLDEVCSKLYRESLEPGQDAEVLRRIEFGLRSTLAYLGGPLPPLIIPTNDQ
jgi:hypothetical protein